MPAKIIRMLLTNNYGALQEILTKLSLLVKIRVGTIWNTDKILFLQIYNKCKIDVRISQK